MAIKEGGWVLDKKHWSHFLSPRNNEPKKECSLDISMLKLVRKASPKMSPAVQIAKYSTRLKAGETDSPTGIANNPIIAKYTIQEPYSRTLCSKNSSNCVNLLPSASEKLPFDLNEGYGKQAVKEDTNEFLSLLLESLAHENLIGQSEFVCFRNLLTALSYTPYEMSSMFDLGMIVIVQKIKGVFYMFAFPTEEAQQAEANLDKRQKEMMYWGMKFESYVTAKLGQQTTLARNRLNFNREFCSVVKRTIGSHSIILRGEIDCCDTSGTYVELKTNKIFDQDGQTRSFSRRKKDTPERSFRRHKLIKWWLQCYLLGVPRILCGFRDGDGFVRKLQDYRTNQLPPMMHRRYTNVCLAFLNSFLDFVKANVTSKFVPHVFQRRAHSSTFKMSQDEEGRYKFIPSWFVDLVRSQ